jgi:hypothetical protein
VYLSSKVGIVVVVLGVMHFFNLFVLSKGRTYATERPHEREEYWTRFNRIRDAVRAD